MTHAGFFSTSNLSSPVGGATAPEVSASAGAAAAHRPQPGPEV
jgi:hypothetical protein